eukprot:jgi/Chrzof1/13646/Cz08g06030.t1
MPPAAATLLAQAQLPTLWPAALGSSLAHGWSDQQVLAAAGPSAAPETFPVTDRQVYVEDANNPPSTYVMCRRWLQNQKQSEVEECGPTPNNMNLPPPPPCQLPEFEAPLYPDDSEEFSAEASGVACCNSKNLGCSIPHAVYGQHLSVKLSRFVTSSKVSIQLHTSICSLLLC